MNESLIVPLGVFASEGERAMIEWMLKRKPPDEKAILSAIYQAALDHGLPPNPRGYGFHVETGEFIGAKA